MSRKEKRLHLSLSPLCLLFPFPSPSPTLWLREEIFLTSPPAEFPSDIMFLNWVLLSPAPTPGQGNETTLRPIRT